MEERKLSLSSPPTGTSSRHEGMPDNRGLVCPFSSGLGNADQRNPILPGVDLAICV